MTHRHHRKSKVISFGQFVGGVNLVAKTLTSPANSLIHGIGKGLSNNSLLLPLIIGGVVVVFVITQRK
jgi:hypothetical protein